MVTVQEIFDMAIHLMDEQRETDGSTVTVDTSEYKYRTISILNTVIPRVFKYSTYYDKDGGQNVPILVNYDYKNPDFDQPVGIDDMLALALLPPYLAAELLSAENDVLSAWFMNQYREALQDVRSNAAGEFEAISTPYGLF